jgi:ribosome recycling factor
MASDAKRQLVEFLIERAFDPVMKARPEGRSDAERKKLKDVQDATRAEIERFRRYGSAKDVVKNFKRDLNSDPAKKVHADLKALNLPTLNEIKDEFEAKASKLGVEASR